MGGGLRHSTLAGTHRGGARGGGGRDAQQADRSGGGTGVDRHGGDRGGLRMDGPLSRRELRLSVGNAHQQRRLPCRIFRRRPGRLQLAGRPIRVRSRKPTCKAPAPTPPSPTTSFSNPWFGTVRGRGGIALNNILFYGTLGLAYGRGELDVAGITESNLHTGFTAGFGLEVGLTQNWSVKAEGLFIDYSGQPYAATGYQQRAQQQRGPVGRELPLLIRRSRDTAQRPAAVCRVEIIAARLSPLSARPLTPSRWAAPTPRRAIGADGRIPRVRRA
jgi:opacity protein-like surface antigen